MPWTEIIRPDYDRRFLRYAKRLYRYRMEFDCTILGTSINSWPSPQAFSASCLKCDIIHRSNGLSVIARQASEAASGIYP
jgi:hypothetical protein